MTSELNAGPAEGRKETLINEFKGMVGNASKLLHEAGHTVSEEIAGTRTAVASGARCVSNATDQYVHKNPWAIVGFAAAAGLIIGAVLSRR
ncbi:MAG: hypothetical protein WAV95_16865 [Azonexus sp.]